MPELSVVICAHNPRPHYLRRVLNALHGQTLPAAQWELVLVDNASTQPLAPAWDLSWHPQGRHVHESALGLAQARLRGMREARAPIMVFVDDDNVLEADYLANVAAIGREWPRLGVWGSGMTYPEFEVEPADELRRYTGYLALRNTPEARWANVRSCYDANPWGAGICIRAEVAKAYREHWDTTLMRITGRSGNTLISGEDKEICYVACGAGLGMGLFPNLRLAHLIPKERVTEEYLVRLREGVELSDYLLGYKWFGVTPRDPVTLFGLAAAIKNILLRQRMERRMYFASKRAAVKALRIIRENKSARKGKPGPAPDLGN